MKIILTLKIFIANVVPFNKINLFWSRFIYSCPKKSTAEKRRFLDPISIERYIRSTVIIFFCEVTLVCIEARIIKADRTNKIRLKSY